jgi:hypothetical protein
MISSTQLPPVPTSPKEARIHPFQVLLTPSENATLTTLAKTYGISKGAFCRFGLNGLMEKAQKDLSSQEGLPVSADTFWRTFGRQ